MAEQKEHPSVSIADQFRGPQTATEVLKRKRDSIALSIKDYTEEIAYLEAQSSSAQFAKMELQRLLASIDEAMSKLG